MPAPLLISGNTNLRDYQPGKTLDLRRLVDIIPTPARGLLTIAAVDQTSHACHVSVFRSALAG
jgi:hypothetical protein